VFVEQLLTDHDRGGIAGAGEVDDFIGCALGINRNASCAGFKHAEVSDAPFRHVVTEKDYPIP
jgi:hypothetical protein